LNNKPNNNNIIYGLDFGTTSLKISKNQLIDSHDFKVLDFLRIRYTDSLIDNNIDMENFKELIIRSFNRIDGLVEKNENDIEKKLLVTLPMSAYSSKMISVSMKVSGNRVEQQHKVDLITKAKENFNEGVILHTAPLNYYLDGKVIKEPVFRTGNNLSMDLFVVFYNEDILEKFNSIFSSLNMKVGKYVAPPFSFINLFLNKIGMKQSDNNVLCIDMGGEVTYAYFVSNGLIRNFISLPYASNIITRDLSYVLKLDNVDAERIKINYSSLLKDIADRQVQYKEKSYELKLINSIVEARYDEIISMIEEELGLTFIIDKKPKLFLLGKGNISGAEKYLTDRWDLSLLEGLNLSTQNEYIYAIGNIHYSQNNEIFLYDNTVKKTNFLSKVLKAVEDFF
jgi:cell division protein FtsA